MANCKQCGKDIARGKWCSDKCRKAFRQHLHDVVLRLVRAAGYHRRTGA
jgi:hypothetical protein